MFEKVQQNQKPLCEILENHIEESRINPVKRIVEELLEDLYKALQSPTAYRYKQPDNSFILDKSAFISDEFIQSNGLNHVMEAIFELRKGTTYMAKLSSGNDGQVTFGMAPEPSAYQEVITNWLRGNHVALHIDCSYPRCYRDWIDVSLSVIVVVRPYL